MELILIISAVVLVAAAAFCVKMFGLVRVGKDERGLSTLEWMLLVAAVGGLATLGVLIVRSSLGGTDDIEETVDNPTVMAARESVANIDNMADCVASDAGGHMGVKTQWDEDEEECIIVEGANTIAAAGKNANARDAFLAKILSSIDTSARRGDDVRGCDEGENADGFFPQRVTPGSELTLTLPTLTGCNEGKWSETSTPPGDYAGYTFETATVKSITRCYTEGTGGESVICAEDGTAAATQLQPTNVVNGVDRGHIASPSGSGATPQLVDIRNGAEAEDYDILSARAAGVRDGTPKIICSEAATADNCQEGSTALPSLPQGLFKVVIQIVIEHDTKPTEDYLVTDYLFVFSLG